MDFPLTASGTHASGRPLLALSPVPDQDHPSTMNQIAWSLMYLLEQQGIAGVAFDPDVTATYTKLHQAIAGMIAASSTALATVAEQRTGTVNTKAATPEGVTAASGNYSKYVSVTTASVTISADDIGALIIASASANAIGLPLLSAVARIGAAYEFINLCSTNVTISRSGTNTLEGVVGSTTAVVLKPGQSIRLVKISATVWATIGSDANYFPNTKSNAINLDDANTLATAKAVNDLRTSLSGYLHVQQREASGTDAGTLTAGVWTTRKLNSIQTNTIAGASCAADQIVLPAGTYEIHAAAAGCSVNIHKIKLFGVSGTTGDLAIGTSENTTQSVDVTTFSKLRAVKTFAVTTTLELRHIVYQSHSTNGGGITDTGFGVDEVYVDVFIKRVP